jgi:anti-sigma regulatory factor (Ser/Thr protein kinase)
MGEAGRNPARIIPAWREFADRNAGPQRRLWGIGEPIWADRSEAELVECQRHESLLNLAFADAPAFRLLCPYDVDALDPAVIAEAHRSHPAIVEGGQERASETCRDLDEVAAPFSQPLPEPTGKVDEMPFGFGTLPELRRFVAGQASQGGLGEPAASDLVLAANEVATNSVRHAGGGGLLRTWSDPDSFVCEVRDRGRIDQPLAGREQPAPGEAGQGLWMVNQLCDLAQVRSFDRGSVVRLHVRRG